MKNAEANATDTAATVAEQVAHLASEKAPSKKGASQKNAAPTGQKAVKGAKTKPAAKKKAKTRKKVAKLASKEASTPRAESKGAKILALIRRSKGATLTEIMKATAWQAHSVRGYLSLAAKKHKLKIESARNEAGERNYKITE